MRVGGRRRCGEKIRIRLVGEELIKRVWTVSSTGLSLQLVLI